MSASYSKVLKIMGFVALLATFMCSNVSSAVAEEGAKKYLINKVAAVVNGEIITLHDLQKKASQDIIRQGATTNTAEAARARQQIFSATLDNMILDILLKHEAERYKIIVKDEEVDNELHMVQQRSGLEGRKFEEQLRAQGTSTEQLKEQLRNNILRQRMVNLMVARKVSVSKEEVEEYYNAHQDMFNIESGMDISLIVFGKGIDAKKVVSEIKKGTITFEQAALQYSIAPSAQSGGHLGVLHTADINPEWRTHLLGLKPGAITAPLQSEGSTIALKLNEKIEGVYVTLEEATPQIEQILRSPRLGDRFSEYAEEIRSKAVIDIRL